MSKVTIADISSGYASTTALNTAFNTLETELNSKVLYRDNPDGEPNQMENDLDMNGYRILNELADSGDGFIWKGNWTTATAYTANDLVYVPLATAGGIPDGYALICRTAHTSGTLSTDYSANKWALFAARGAAGAGSGDLIAANNLSDVASVSTARTNLGLGNAATATIGVGVQAYDSNTAKLNVDQSWTGAQRGAVTAKTDGTLIDLADGNNFNWTPAGADELSFTNETAGQSGFILLNNPSAYTITSGGEVYHDSSFLGNISVAGTYLLSYFVIDSTHTYVVASGALS